MNKQTKKISRFGIGLLIYAIVFLILVCIGIAVFCFYLSAYESSRPLNIATEYVKTVSEEHLQSLLEPQLKGVNQTFSDVSALEQSLTQRIKSATVAKDLLSNSDLEIGYYLVSDDTPIERITVSKTGENTFGFPTWAVTEEKLLLDDQLTLQSGEISVPPEYKVFCNGVPLDSSYIANSAAHYSFLEGFYENEDYTIPTLVTYRVENCVGTPVFTATDASGNSLTQDQLTEATYINNCSDAEKAELKQFGETFLRHYIDYTSSGAYDYYYILLGDCVHHGSLYEDIVNSAGGFGFASSHGDTLISFEMDQCMKIAENVYVIDLQYDVQTVGSKGAVSTNHYSMKLIVEKDDNVYYANAMTLA